MLERDSPPMIFVLISLWSVAALLIILDRKSGSTRWLSGVAFCGGAGALAVVIGDFVIPQLEADGSAAVRERWIPVLKAMQAGASLTSYYGMPFAFLMFALHYRRILPAAGVLRFLPLPLFVPVLIFLWVRPEYSAEQPIYFDKVVWWAVPYVIAGTLLMLGRREWTNTARRIHGLTCLAVLAPVMFSTVMNYVLPSFGWYGMWRYNPWIIAFAFIIFLAAIFNYGFMGMRILIQKRRLDSTLRAVTSGTAILHHAVKNDIGKILLFSDKMKAQAEQAGDRELLRDIGVIRASAEHVQEMLSRVHHRTQDLALRKEAVDLGELLDAVLDSNAAWIAESGVRVERSYSHGLLLHGDRAQLMEAMHNVVANALEVLAEGGRLTVRTRAKRKFVEIEFADNGPGIRKKDLPLVLEPFFTTKAGQAHNYGLGLAYSYNVVKKHGGELDIFSSEGKGTTVVFRLPRLTLGERNGRNESGG